MVTQRLRGEASARKSASKSSLGAFVIYSNSLSIDLSRCHFSLLKHLAKIRVKVRNAVHGTGSIQNCFEQELRTLDPLFKPRGLPRLLLCLPLPFGAGGWDARVDTNDSLAQCAAEALIMEVNRVPELCIGEVDITSISELGETVDGLSLPIHMVCGDISSKQL